MSAMLGSSRRDNRSRVRLQNGEIVLAEGTAGPFRTWMQWLITRLEMLFSPPGSRP